MTAAQILADGISKRFGRACALDGVSLNVQGGIVTLLGPNGSGKTSLLRCLATVTSVDGGELLVDGLDPRYEIDRREVRRRLGYLPQEPGFVRSARVFDLVDYLAVLRGSRDERRRRTAVFAVLERVGLAARAGDRVADLSGGMRRRLGLAQALLCSPTLLVLDEPEAGLDPDERQQLREIVTERRSEATIVLSTHRTEEAALSDRIVVLDAGRAIFAGSPAELVERAAGCTWEQPSEPVDVRASWRQADGSYRCLGVPPAGAHHVPPTLEDGYLLLIASS